MNRDDVHSVSSVYQIRDEHLENLRRTFRGMSLAGVEASEAMQRMTRAIAGEFSDKPTLYVIQEEP